MKLTHMLVETGISERRAVVFADDRPVALFHDSPLIDRGPRLGTRHNGVLQSLAPDLGGGFCVGPAGTDVFVRLPKRSILARGAHVSFEIVAEAHANKTARARLIDEIGEGSSDALEAWIGAQGPEPSLLPANEKDEFSTINAAFEAALATQIGVPGGGRLTMTRTPALTAIDIDSAGRSGCSAPLNIGAAKESARQLALRGLGGLAVIDCVAPISKSNGSAIKAAFLETFRAISTRKAAALAPSPFGLMEISLAWSETPIDEYLTDGCGSLTPTAQLLDGLRLLEQSVKWRPAAELRLALPVTALNIAEQSPGGRNALAETYSRALGPRIEFIASLDNRTEVIRQ